MKISRCFLVQPWNIDSEAYVIISIYSTHIWFKHIYFIYLDCERVKDYDNPSGNDFEIFHEK